jgi:ABC-2 type transport system permease protein
VTTPAAALMFTRTARRSRRQPGVAFGPAIVPPLLIGTIFTALFRGVAHLPHFPVASYQEWVLPGTLFLTAVAGAGFTAAEVLRDLDSGFYDRVRLSAAAPFSLVGGRAAFETARALLAAGVILVVALAEGVHVESAAGAAAALALTAMFATAWNGIFFLSAVTTRNGAAVLGLQPLFFPVMLFSTWFGPPLLMPPWFAQIARRNPVTWDLEATRALLAGHADWGYIALTLAFVVALAALTYGLAGRAFSRLDG